MNPEGKLVDSVMESSCLNREKLDYNLTYLLPGIPYKSYYNNKNNTITPSYNK
jgi:hypothetical protein